MGVIFRWPSTAYPTTHWSLKEVTPPTTEPITLTQAKLHLKIDDTLRDAKITAAIIAARDQVERESGRFVAIGGIYDYTIDYPPSDGVLVLPRGPVASVTSFTIYDIDDAATVVASGNYLTDLQSDPPRVVLDYAADPVWRPNSDLRAHRAGVLRFVGGAASVPAWAVQAVYLLLEWWESPKPDPAVSLAYDRLINLNRLEGVA